MYLTLIEINSDDIMLKNRNLLTSFTLQLHSVTPCIWLGTTQSCNPPRPNDGLWVNLLSFMMCIYKHCFPPMLLVFAMKCCTKMPCSLPHNHYCCLLSSPICLPHSLICTCLISSPTACPPSSVLCWCLLRFFLCFFLIYATFLCDSILDFLCTYFCQIGFCVSPLFCLSQTLCCFHSVVSLCTFLWYWHCRDFKIATVSSQPCQ